jgi:hypothetical protein
MQQNNESQILTRYWIYLALIIFLWLGISGYLLWRLQPYFNPPLALPSAPTIPTIDEPKINLVQERLRERQGQASFPSPVGTYRSEPFD